VCCSVLRCVAAHVKSSCDTQMSHVHTNDECVMMVTRVT